MSASVDVEAVAPCARLVRLVRIGGRVELLDTLVVRRPFARLERPPCDRPIDEVEQQAGALATLTEDLAGHRESLAARTQELTEAEASLEAAAQALEAAREEAEARTHAAEAARLDAAELEREVAAQRGIVDELRQEASTLRDTLAARDEELEQARMSQLNFDGLTLELTTVDVGAALDGRLRRSVFSTSLLFARPCTCAEHVEEQLVSMFMEEQM